jgi:hypothetical protein
VGLGTSTRRTQQRPLALLMAVCGLFAANRVARAGKDPPRDVSLSQGKVVFLRGNDVWVAKADGSDASQLTADGKDKWLPRWSSDGAKIIYALEGTVTNKQQSQAVVISADGNEIKSILPIDPSDRAPCVSINAAEFIDEQRIGVECHYNPSTSRYIVIDLGSGNTLASFLGYAFRWSPDRTQLAHVGWIPHFAPPEATSEYLQIGDRTVYAPQKGNEHHDLSPFYWAPDSRHIAFIDRVEIADQQALVVLAGDKVEARWTMPADQKSAQEIDWVDGHNLLLCDGENVSQLDLAAGRLVPTSEAARHSYLAKRSLEQEARKVFDGSIHGYCPDWWFPAK